ncbi:MAG: cysteine desulfurase [Vicinamibacteria bacterium]|nr:cysteine desulfurase [Vicinamibacteria bacterium]MCL4821373.1 cysteine desulfurase [Vicinamibacteria bacterium]
MSAPAPSPVAAGPLDVAALRAEFPVLRQRVHGKPLVFLDSAASSQKPQVVIDAERRCYEEYYANIHRGVHKLSQLSTEAYEGAREDVRRFLGASSPKEVVFTRGTTESVNLVAQTWGRKHVGPGDEVLITALEHHSNIVPWQMLCEERHAKLKVAPIDDRGAVLLDQFEKQLSVRTKLCAFAHVSNALGTVNPVKQMAAMAKKRGAVVLVDGAQALPRLPVDVQDLGCDFYAFSGHKAYGPSGIGVLWGRRELLEAMPPWQGGGDMILSVTFGKTLYNELPYKFEAGTPNIAGGIALGAAIRWLESKGMQRILAHEDAVLRHGTEALLQVPGLTLVGTAPEKAGVLSFVLEGIHPHDIGQVLDSEGVAIRTGHHCAQPVMDRYGIPATARASLGVYNTTEDLDALVRALHKVREMFG